MVYTVLDRDGSQIQIPDNAVIAYFGIKIQGDGCTDWNEPLQQDLVIILNRLMNLEDSTASSDIALQANITNNLNIVNTNIGSLANEITTTNTNLATLGNNVVTTVAGRKGTVTLTKDDVGLTNVDNTADNTKAVLTATKLVTARTIALAGDVSGNVSFDGTVNVSINAIVADDSHNHAFANITSKPTTLSGYGITDAAVLLHGHAVVSIITDGFMTAVDKIKLDGIQDGALNYVLPTATPSVLGGVRSGVDIAIDSSGLMSVVDDSHNHVFANITSTPTVLSGYGITDAINISQKGVANGVATLDATGVVPSSQLPSYVDDVLEFTNLAGFPVTGEMGKIYVAKDTNKTYRWSGSTYVAIASGGSTITNDITTNSTMYPMFSTTTTGELSAVNVSSTKLQFNPSNGTLSSTVFSALSDVRYKTNITNIGNGLEVINQLRAVEYNLIDSNDHSSGVIAQELEKVLPFLVIDSADHKTVNYMGIIAYLISAVQELSIEVTALKK